MMRMERYVGCLVTILSDRCLGHCTVYTQYGRVFFFKAPSAVVVAGRILRKHRRDLEYYHGFSGRVPNLTELPPELSIQVLSHLNATDLCLAACVWQQLATDEILWSGLCRSKYHVLVETNLICT